LTAATSAARTHSASDILATARRFDDDADLLAFGLLGQGQAAVAAGDTARGLRLLDEAMLGVAAGDVSPIPTGIIYCAVIASCLDAFDLRRAAEWTEALHGWCTAQPDLVPYRGQCLVHRSQVLQAYGAWDEAVTEADHALLRLARPVHPALGLGWYQRGELHRPRGEPAQAERAYRAALAHGQEPVPGLALLRLAEGDIDAAGAAVQRMMQEDGGPATTCAVRAAAVEILLAAEDVAGRARRSRRPRPHRGHGWRRPAAGRRRPRHGDGSAGGGRRAGRPRHAPAAVHGMAGLRMPYAEAVTRVEIAQACRALGDRDAAEYELDAARMTFERLGARPDLARVARITGREPRSTVLTGRECEVLRLVAAGHSNGEIASELVISTPHRRPPLQNIFTKAGLSSRAAATAYAYEHDLV
jgi:DNA-binding CsgD family transcriptional regulator